MRPGPQHRTRKIASSRLRASSPATVSGYNCLFTGEMLCGYLLEFKPLTVLHLVRTATLLFFLFQVRLPDYLVIITLDQKAFASCKRVGLPEKMTGKSCGRRRR
ncbi:hypothetical protein HanRHA438_Chr07g0302571 [Helianthus annuus]|nr:hypothetical protein HanRHA438_Chr07g0302571 [Helianthus annuus]